MRKPRDFDSELKALNDRAKQLKDNKLRQLGELVIATGADGLAIEELAGALLAAAGSRDCSLKEGWSAKGAAFFQGTARDASRRIGQRPEGATPNDGGAASA